MEHLAEHASQGTKPDARVADMALLIRRVREFLAERKEETGSWPAPYDFAALAARFGFSERRKGRAEVILSDEVALELGHPSTSSRAVVLVSHEAGLVQAGRISIVGPDLDGLDPRGPNPFAQIVLVALRAGGMPDPFEMENAQYLLHRLPGYMVRSVPGRLWVRVSRAGREAGLTLQTVGSALIATYLRDFEEVEAAEVVFVTSRPEDVEALSLIAAEANILAGRHKKLALGVDGEIECPELACDTCDEKPVCDSLRDIVIKRRSQRK